MEILRETLRILFLERDSEHVIGRLFGDAGKSSDVSSVNKNWFVHAFGDNELVYTADQRENVFDLLKSDWMRKDKEWSTLCGVPHESIFNVLLHFSSPILTEIKGEPVCDFNSILRWHNLTNRLDEDLFTTSYLASKDIALCRKRAVFDWPAFIGTNNSQLKQMFEKRMADLHNHLKGSSDNFSLNWMSLMKDVRWREADFKRIEKYMEPKRILTPGSSSSQLHVDVIKAAAIRQFLQSPKPLQKERHYLCALLKSTNLLEVLTLYDNIYYPYTEIELARKIDATPIWEERRFLYTMFCQVYESSIGEFAANLLYVYLIIKYRLKHELMQLNDREGFANFSDYEVRKTLFIKDGSRYDKLLVKSFMNNFWGKNGGNRYLETRITPKNSALGMNKELTSIGTCVEDGQDVHYIIHFIKQRDKNLYGDLQSSLQCRHYKLRKEVKTKALALDEWRNLYGENGKIAGIDAANSEIFCRPEVFAQAFRFIREQLTSQRITLDEKPASWGFTYHVGEDFLGIVDGLRAVDEVLHFMNFRQGDRFGHGLVLGMKVKNYYERRHNRISLPKQVLLDNIVWLLVKGKCSPHYNMAYNELTWIFERLSREIYDNNNIYSYKDFYDSWLLRGDNPECYMSGKYIERVLSYWGKCDRNFQDKDACVAHGNKNAQRLYCKYHYNQKAKKEGAKCEVFEVKPEYIDLVQDMQRCMLNEVEKLQIAIETSPSSNLKIGNLQKYCCHPILTFYNVGLECEGNQQSHAIPVSINTDDLGVFGTSLEREFTLMAAALEKDFKKGYHHNPPRIIYRWLDDIREQAFEQRFSDGLYAPKKSPM